MQELGSCVWPKVDGVFQDISSYNVLSRNKWGYGRHTLTGQRDCRQWTDLHTRQIYKSCTNRLFMMLLWWLELLSLHHRPEISKSLHIHIWRLWLSWELTWYLLLVSDWETAGSKYILNKHKWWVGVGLPALLFPIKHSWLVFHSILLPSRRSHHTFPLSESSHSSRGIIVRILWWQERKFLTAIRGEVQESIFER